MGTSSKIHHNAQGFRNSANKYGSFPDNKNQKNFLSRVNEYQKKMGLDKIIKKEIEKKIQETLTDYLPSISSVPNEYQVTKYVAKKAMSSFAASSPFGIGGAIAAKAAYRTANRAVKYQGKNEEKEPDTLQEAKENAQHYYKDKGSEGIAKDYTKDLTYTTLETAMDCDNNPALEQEKKEILRRVEEKLG